MDPKLYKAASTGDLSVLEQEKAQFGVQLTPNNNTVLHIASLFGKIGCVKKIIITCPPLLFHKNTNGDTPLHIASREGLPRTARVLIEHAKVFENNNDVESGRLGGARELLRMANEQGNTALHEAVQYRHVDVAKLLIEEDPEFSCPPNNDEETPLYLAVEKRLDALVSDILNTCVSPSYGGPDGRTALHAAVFLNSEGNTTRLLEWKQGFLSKEEDRYGWAPLECAAYFGFAQIVRQLLEFNKSLAYHTVNDTSKQTALHIAASRGHIDVMVDIISYCPDCWEMVTGAGRNILHIAVMNTQNKVAEYIWGNRSMSSLLNQKDINGDTPLHMHAASKLNAVQLLMDPRVEKMVYNKEKMTPLDIANSDKYLDDTGVIRWMLKKYGATIGYRPKLISNNVEDQTKLDEKAIANQCKTIYSRN